MNVKNTDVKTQIGILDLGYESYAYEENIFSKQGYSLKFYRGKADDTQSKIEFSKDCDGLLIRVTNVGTEFLNKLPNLKLRGIMAIPECSNNINQQLINFAKLLKLYIVLKQQFSLDTLSIGMSNDYQAEIK